MGFIMFIKNYLIYWNLLDFCIGKLLKNTIKIHTFKVQVYE